MKCNAIRVVSSRLVDAMPVYARFLPFLLRAPLRDALFHRPNSKYEGGERGGGRYLAEQSKSKQRLRGWSLRKWLLGERGQGERDAVAQRLSQFLPPSLSLCNPTHELVLTCAVSDVRGTFPRSSAASVFLWSSTSARKASCWPHIF